MNESDTARTLRLLDFALGAMNEAVRLTIDQGPAVAMESIADYLNDTDSADEDVANETRWEVTQSAARKAQLIINTNLQAYEGQP